MRPICRQLVTGALLAVYGAISLLGQGLHWLSPEGHHHHGLLVAHCEHDHSPHAHHHAPSAVDLHRDTPLEVTPTDCIAQAHECDICAFLLQVRSERPQIATAVVWQHVVAAAPAALQRSYSPISLGPHAPRGPPLDLA